MASIVQSAHTGDSAIASPYVDTFDGAVTVGHLLAAVVARVGNSELTYTFSDSVNGTWPSENQIAVYNATVNRMFLIGWVRNTGAGTPTITVTPSSGSNTARLAIFEISATGVGAVALPGSHAHTTTANSHPCADAPGLSYPAGAVVLAGGVLSGSSSVTSANANYTKYGPVNDTMLMQYREAASPVTDDLGTWSNTGSARSAVNAMVAFYNEAAPPSRVYSRVTRRRLPGGLL